MNYPDMIKQLIISSDFEILCRKSHTVFMRIVNFFFDVRYFFEALTTYFC